MVENINQHGSKEQQTVNTTTRPFPIIQFRGEQGKAGGLPSKHVLEREHTMFPRSPLRTELKKRTNFLTMR